MAISATNGPADSELTCELEWRKNVALITSKPISVPGEAQRKIATVQPERNPVAHKVVVSTEQLQSGSATLQLADRSQVRDSEGILLGYICPGCQKQLSISGWSRHKHSCKQYQSVTLNGR